MHKGLMEFPNLNFYSGDIESKATPSVTSPIPIFNNEKPIIFINVAG